MHEATFDNIVYCATCQKMIISRGKKWLLLETTASVAQNGILSGRMILMVYLEIPLACKLLKISSCLSSFAAWILTLGGCDPRLLTLDTNELLTIRKLEIWISKSI